MQCIRQLHVECAHAIFFKISIFGVFIAISSEKVWRQFFDSQCLGVLHIKEENERHIWNPEETLSQKHVFCVQDIDLEI